jgi:hypothetical protein
MEKEGFGEEFSICSAVFFLRNSGGIFGGKGIILNQKNVPNVQKYILGRDL